MSSSRENYILPAYILTDKIIEIFKIEVGLVYLYF